MPQDIKVLEQIGQSAPQQMTVLIIVCAAALQLVGNHRTALLLLFLQYVLLAIYVGPRVYGPLALLQAGIGLAVCLILLVSINHLHKNRFAAKQPVMAARWLYRVLVVIFSSLAAYGLWRTNILQLNWLEGMVSYFLVSVGLVMAAISDDPLRLGFGILVSINGFETVSAFMNQGLLVIGMWGIIAILLALAIAAGTEIWLEGQEKAVNS